MTRAMFVSALLLASLSITDAVQPNREMTELTANELAIVKFAKEIKEYDFVGEGNTSSATLSAYITENLLPKADETKAMLQSRMDAARSDVVACYRIVTGAGPDQDAATDDLNANEGKEDACMKLDRSAMTEEMKICESFAHSAMGFQPPKLKKVKHSLKLFEKALKQYYAYYPQFMEEKNACWEATGEEHSQHAHCLFRKNYIDKSFCALKHNMTALCSEYSKCFKQKVVGMQEMEAKVRKLDNHTKKVYQGLYCMAKNTGWKFADDVDSIVSEVVDDANIGCEDTDTSHLTITYPDVPQQEPCNPEVKSASHLESSVQCADDAKEAPTEDLEAITAAPSAGPGAS